MPTIWYSSLDKTEWNISGSCRRNSISEMPEWCPTYTGRYTVSPGSPDACPTENSTGASVVVVVVVVVVVSVVVVMVVVVVSVVVVVVVVVSVVVVVVMVVGSVVVAPGIRMLPLKV